MPEQKPDNGGLPKATQQAPDFLKCFLMKLNRTEPPSLSLIAFIIWIYELPGFNGKYKKRLQRHWLVKYFYNCETYSKAHSFSGEVK